MNRHNLFYYPYASFTNDQLPLLKVAALYFDNLYILDPVGASWDTVGADYIARDAITLLKDAGILEIVTPASVLTKYEDAISEAILRDMSDRTFLDLCEDHSRTSGKQHWTLSLAKVPEDLRSDQRIRHLMGDFARQALLNSSPRARRSDDYVQYDETEIGAILDQTARLQSQNSSVPAIPVYDEYREGYNGGGIEYRYADFPLALGEAIMMNHALFTGLLHFGATPITDDPFHNQALSLKLRQASQDPIIQQAQADRLRNRQLKNDLLATTLLTDSQLSLPILNPQLPLEVILEYRQKNDAALQATRDRLGWLSRRIESEPWSEEFAQELEHKTIPNIADELDEARKARDAWLASQRGRLALQGTGVVAGTAAAVLAVFTTPVAPVALATAGLGLFSGSVIPGTEWLLDWRDGKNTVQENGLHYLLKI